MKLEKKVLTIFGVVIRPTNWIIFGLGLIFVGLSIYQIIWQGVKFIEFLILLATGLGLVADGYGNVKEDEPVESKK